MSYGLKARIDKLQRADRGRRVCPQCQGKTVQVIWEGEEERDPKPCLACGKIGKVTQFRVAGGRWIHLNGAPGLDLEAAP